MLGSVPEAAALVIIGGFLGYLSPFALEILRAMLTQRSATAAEVHHTNEQMIKDALLPAAFKLEELHQLWPNCQHERAELRQLLQSHADLFARADVVEDLSNLSEPRAADDIQSDGTELRKIMAVKRRLKRIIKQRL
ncbi:MAG: hypothetical protein NVSMB52_01770 [Chloroflexota bacterium]